MRLEKIVISSLILLILSTACIKKKSEPVTPNYVARRDTLIVSWDKCQQSADVAGFLLLWGKNSFLDTLTVPVLTDSIFIDTNLTSYGVEIVEDSIFQYGGYEFFFSIIAIDTAGNYSVNSDTVSYSKRMLADLNKDGIINIYDQLLFDESYKFLYGKEYRETKTKKKIPEIILRFE